MTHHDSSDDIQRRDQVLELLYWMHGEGLGASATIAGLGRFIDCDASQLQTTLDTLVRRGDVEHTTTGIYALTDTGRREAARRFAEEFAPFLKQGHGECNDPDCECHTSPDGAAACHARVHEAT